MGNHAFTCVKGVRDSMTSHNELKRERFNILALHIPPAHELFYRQSQVFVFNVSDASISTWEGNKTGIYKLKGANKFLEHNGN